MQAEKAQDDFLKKLSQPKALKTQAEHIWKWKHTLASPAFTLVPVQQAKLVQ